MKTRIVSAAVTAARIKMNKERWLNPEYRNKMLDVFCQKGKPRSPDQLQKMSAAKKGRPLTLKHRRAIKRGWRNKKLNNAKK